jgi:hypothetical protein
LLHRMLLLESCFIKSSTATTESMWHHCNKQKAWNNRITERKFHSLKNKKKYTIAVVCCCQICQIVSILKDPEHERQEENDHHNDALCAWGNESGKQRTSSKQWENDEKASTTTHTSISSVM